ncbi:hypothetical protein FB451DRAFT_1236747 [Mycena latifolia]|nr:hypothetical protein FB451DRAFT_1236747 [Mycena latifolia]
MFPTFRWLHTWVTDPVPVTRSHLVPFDPPNEIWALIFQDSSLRKRDLVAIFASCHHFHVLVLPILLSNAEQNHPHSPPETSCPLAPQRMVTEPFCELLSSLPRDPDAPVVFVGTEVFTCRAADIRNWQLDNYMFDDTSAWAGLSSLLRSFTGMPTRSPLRTKISIKQHNGLHTNVFPFISISSLDIQHLPGPFSTECASWTLAILNPDLSHWPSALHLSAPLAGTEWAAILPLLTFPNLPLLRMNPQPEGTIPTVVLDAFLNRHHALTRMSYYPDPLTLPTAPAFPHAALPRLRNITTSALGALHLFRAPEAFPHLFAVRMTGAVLPSALLLLAHHAGHNKLILEVSTGSWMDAEDAVAAAALHRVDTLVLVGATDFVSADAVLRWVSLFPALRRVALQDLPFGRARCLPEHVELMSTHGVQ